MNVKTPLFAALLAIAAGATAGHAEGVVMTGKSGNETFLVDANKMTLYVFDKDAKNQSNCYDDCAAKWPPLTADAGTALPQGYGLVDRKDGTKQVAYKGQPLYLWFKDSEPGQMTGDGVKGVWHVARP